MADRWVLVTPLGDYQLNATFYAPNLHPGGVDTNAAVRREGRNTYQRTGDGLRTPGPLRLNGRVWRDDRNIKLLVDELDDIRNAVTSTIQVRRMNDAGTYLHSELAGGPPPAVTPDGLGGWFVEIELWPGRAEPTFIAATLDTHIYVWVDTSGSVNEPAIAAAVASLKARLQTEVYGDIDVDTRVFYSSAWTDERWVAKMKDVAAAAPDALGLLFINEAAPEYHAESGASAEPTPAYLSDHAAFLQQVASSTRFAGILYAVTLEGPGYPIFKAHIGKALAGTDSYPAGLAQRGIRARLDADPNQDADAYFNDIVSLLRGV